MSLGDGYQLINPADVPRISPDISPQEAVAKVEGTFWDTVRDAGIKFSGDQGAFVAAGRALQGVGMAALGYGLYESGTRAILQIGAGNYRGAANTMANFGGAVAGAMAEAEAGAAAGVLAGPVGSAVGAMLGGLGGAIAGAASGEALADAVAKGIGDLMKGLGDLAKSPWPLAQQAL